eukprot:comp21595_c0_seq1/m.30226 comp21595_c0_seq1/g.30226  ORF comp21595_c0_seq1/g.30226 comp21595_c0_seq1/m.30226 type:complete len:403 (-) comp21595_c0_seq1:777-1985(-)
MDGYVRDLNDAIRRQNSKAMARLFSLKDQKHCEAVRVGIRQGYEKMALRNVMSVEWRDLLEIHMTAIIAPNLSEKFERQEELVKDFLKMFKKETGWLNQCMGTIISDFRHLATQLDLTHSPPSQESRTQAARLIQMFLTPSVMDKSDAEDSRKWGTLYVANNLLKMYMQVTSKLSDNVIRSIDHNFDRDTINDRFPKAEVVTFRYMMGIQLFYKGEYSGAADNLQYAFDHCLHTSTHNKRMILLYLVPCRLWQGSSPTVALLQKYNLGIYIEIVRAVREGNVGLLTQFLSKYEDVFVRKGLYLLLDRLRLLAYRNLFRKTVAIRADILKDTPEFAKTGHAVELSWFVQALSFQGDTNDPEEVECIIANLIYKNYIRGYIHRAQRKLVLSKQKPFPPVKEVKN